MVGQRRKLLASLLVIATLALAIAATTFLLVDLSGEAEPSSLETRLASRLLQMKLRWNGASQSSPLTPTEDDLVRCSEIYEERCAVCHGATRGKPALFAKSFSPRPPQFVIQPAQKPTWMDAYVIQHGIRWTGMPAFRGLSAADAWRLALYVEGRSKPRER